MPKTTTKHFACFKRECECWIDRYGLKDWHIYFEHCEIEDRPRTCAMAETDLENRIARITLNDKWENLEPTCALLRNAAYHEVCHVLLCRLTELALSREIFKNVIDDEIHAVIRRLENGISEKNEGKQKL